MKRIVLLFGGDSCERDISIISGVQAYENIDKEKYEVIPVYFYSSEFYRVFDMNVDSFISFDASKAEKIEFTKGGIRTRGIFGRKNEKVDAVFICAHGGNGENGSLQGFFDILCIPYTSSEVLASGVGMDKIATKYVVSSLGINTVEYVAITSGNEIDYDKIEEKLGYPMIVKPSRLGSSIGIERVSSREALIHAIELAFYYDNRVLIEKALVGFDEYNCAAVKTDAGVLIGEIEKPSVKDDMLGFDDKYLVSGKMNGGYRELPANISEELKEEIETATLRVYGALGMKGAVRIDYLYSEGTLYLNEVNTIPGSLAFYLFESKGIPYGKLIDIMIDNALKEKERDRKLIKYYNSSVLNCVKTSANKLIK